MTSFAEGLRSCARVLNLPTDAHTHAALFADRARIVARRLAGAGEAAGGSGGLDVIELTRTVWSDPVSRSLHSLQPDTDARTVEVSAQVRLGGVCLLRAGSEAEADTVLRLIAGVAVTAEHSPRHSLYVPPFLKLAYVSETPMLVEVSSCACHMCICICICRPS